MAPKRRYLNAQYADPRNSKKFTDGHQMWLSADVKRGKRPRPPTVTWVATRKRNGDDGQYVENPKFTALPKKPSEDVYWACVELPRVTGVQWKFEAIRHKQNKADKTIPIKGEYETWKRYFLNIVAADAELLKLFESGLTMVKAAFGDACIELVKNLVTIGGKATVTKDRSKTGERRRGEVLNIKLSRPSWTDYDIDYTFWVQGTQTSTPNVQINGSTLTITLDEGSKWCPKLWLWSLEARAGTHTLMSLSHRGDNQQLEPRDAVRALKALSTRVSDRTMEIDLDAAPVANSWNGKLKTWTNNRKQTVLQALNRGARVHFQTKVSFWTFGGSNGKFTPGQGCELFVTQGKNRMASVFCHELGHALSLVQRSSVKLYDAQRHRYESDAAPQAKSTTEIQYFSYYTSAYGGTGTHCNQGTTLVRSQVTTAGWTYKPTGKLPLCLMYHTSLVDKYDTILTNAVTFCPGCIRQLRGR